MIIQEKIIFFPNLVDMFREISWFLTFAFQWRQARCRPIWKQPQVHRIAWIRGYKSLSLNGRQVNHQIFSLCRVSFSGEGLFGILIPLREYLLSSFRLPLYRKVCRVSLFNYFTAVTYILFILKSNNSTFYW